MEHKIKILKKNKLVDYINSENNDFLISNHGKLMKFFLYGRAFFPFFLSHHPECNYFKGHTIKFGKFRLCIGCFIGYPIAIFSLLIFNIIKLYELIPQQTILLLSIIFLGLFFLSPLNLIVNKTMKIVQKIFMGIGAALLMQWIMLFPNSSRVNLNIAFIVFYIIITLFNLYHIYSICITCYKCECPFDWGNCPGFKTIRINMERFNLPNFLITLEKFSHKIKSKRSTKKNQKRILC